MYARLGGCRHRGINLTRGLKTQEAVVILSDSMAVTGKFVTRLFYYDRGRVIQIAERNAQGGVSRYSMKYDFNGRVPLVQETHQRTSGKPDSDTKRTQYVHDARGRLLSQTITLNQAQSAVSYVYDELGKLSSKTTTATGNATPLTIGYEYDIRGQLTAINSSRAYSQKNEYSPAGNITRMIVNAPLFQLNGVTYTYNYDGMNHLRRAARSQASKTVIYNMDYDQNGNVTRFLRDKRTLSKSIAQYYSYEGNQLNQMQCTATDTADIPGIHRFGYDGNGNMIGKRTENGQPLIDFGYNYLNLTDAISTPQGPTLFTWLADGTRAQTRKVSGGQESGTVYLGSLMYDYTNTTLSVETLFDGGMIGNAQTGHYSTLYITDHLGSVRVLVSGQPMLFNEYEPFGMLEKEYSVSLFPQMPPQLNDRLFNGKQELFPAGESILDYGARLYDPTLARWIAPDPLAEIYYSESPFSFSGNNPINNVDINGMSYQEPEPKYIYDWDTNKYLDQETDESVNFETFWSWVMETYPVEVVDGIFRSASNTLSTPKFDGNTYFSLDGSQYSVNSPDVLDVIARDLAKLNFNEAQPILKSLMDSISHIQWSEGMPTQIQILNILFVVPVSTLTYTDATSKTLKNQYENYLIETGQYSRLHPYYTPNLSGDMAMIFGFLVMNTWAPVGFLLSGLDYSEKINFDIADAQHKVSYYRKDGIIK